MRFVSIVSLTPSLNFYERSTDEQELMKRTFCTNNIPTYVHAKASEVNKNLFGDRFCGTMKIRYWCQYACYVRDMREGSGTDG